jgi:cytochrome c peroxidase
MSFMHDGRFSSLDQVIEHYSAGVQLGPALDNRLRGGNGGQPVHLNLSNQDKSALVDFLKTLTDETFVSDTKFRTPFRNESAPP